MSETITGLRARAIDAYERDARFRQMAQSTAHEAMAAHGAIDPENADRDAHQMVLDAVALLMQRFYEEDAELRAQKELADRYRKLAEDALAISPRVPFMIIPDSDAVCTACRHKGAHATDCPRAAESWPMIEIRP